MTAALKTYHGSVYDVTDQGDGTVTLHDTGKISAKDGWKTALIPGLAEIRTAQSVAMLGYLKACGIPVAYIELVNATTIRLHKAKMIKLECIVRRDLIGSYHDRHPDVPMQRWPELVWETFAKEALDLRDPANPKLVDGNALRREFTRRAGGNQAAGWKLLEPHKEQGELVFDPLIEYRNGEWWLYDPKAVFQPDRPIHRLVAPVSPEVVDACKAIALPAFGFFEAGLAIIDCRKVASDVQQLLMADIKVEFGTMLDGELVLADVVNLDSCRLLKNGRYAKEDHLSKQPYRDDVANDEKMFEKVLNIYRQGLAAVEQLTA